MSQIKDMFNSIKRRVSAKMLNSLFVCKEAHQVIQLIHQTRWLCTSVLHKYASLSSYSCWLHLKSSACPWAVPSYFHVSMLAGKIVCKSLVSNFESWYAWYVQYGSFQSATIWRQKIQRKTFENWMNVECNIYIYVYVKWRGSRGLGLVDKSNLVLKQKQL